MLFVSFLRHSPSLFPEGNLVYLYIYRTSAPDVSRSFCLKLGYQPLNQTHSWHIYQLWVSGVTERSTNPAGEQSGLYIHVRVHAHHAWCACMCEDLYWCSYWLVYFRNYVPGGVFFSYTTAAVVVYLVYVYGNCDMVIFLMNWGLSGKNCCCGC